MDYVNTIPYNSFEFGKASKRHKIYYLTIEELTTKLVKLKNLGLIDEEFSLDFKSASEV